MQKLLNNKVVIICGPTASGKSNYAIDYAIKNNGVIINCDSQQIYKDLKILTARPDGNDLKIVSHRLYGFLSGLQDVQNFSVVDWLNLASSEINNTFDKGMLPILVGGTGFYISALIDGISIIPNINSDVRKHVRSMKNDDIYLNLQKSDPDIASKLSVSDTQRIMRALEVFLSTGKTLTYWQNIPRRKILPNIQYDIIYKNPGRNIILQNISKRIDFMLKNGAIDEVEKFLKLNYPLTAPVSKSIGVAEIKQYINGSFDFDTMKEQITIKTRQYAKRQNTWIKNQLLKYNKISYEVG